jgi:hypothetical protein
MQSGDSRQQVEPPKTQMPTDFWDDAFQNLFQGHQKRILHEDMLSAGLKKRIWEICSGV